MSVSFPIPHRYSHTWLRVYEDKKLPMDVVWSDYDTCYSLSVCMKSPSIYIIMARLAIITGMEWSKIYEKLHSVLIWSPQRGRLVNVANYTDKTWTKGLYIPRKVSGYSVYTSTFWNGVYTKQGKVDYHAQQSQLQTVTRRNTKSTTQKVSSLLLSG